MRNQTLTTSLLGGLLVLVLATSSWGVPITLFMDTDTFLKRAKDIVIVEVTDISAAKSEGRIDGFYPVDINILMTLKGDKAKGKAILATIYPVEKGKRYLVSSLGGSAFGTDLLALPELSVIPLSAYLDLKTFEGKPLKEQVSLGFKERLDDVIVAQKALAKERALLEKGVEPPHGLWAALTVPEPVVSMDQVHDLSVNFALINDSGKPLDPEVSTWVLFINGEPCLDSALIFGNGPRDQRWQSLPAGERLDFRYRLGDYFKKAGTYTIWWHGEGFESDPLMFRVIEKPH